MDGEATEENMFRTKLMDILHREYGRRGVTAFKDGKIRIHTNDGTVDAWTDSNNAVFISRLTDPNGDILTIPKEDIAEYLPRTANMYICPALYETQSNKNYVPHYNFLLHGSDLENPESVTMVIDKLAFLASVASRLWRETEPGQDTDDEGPDGLRGPTDLPTVRPVP